MVYFVVYDYNDNIIAYIDTLDELSRFVNRRKRQLKYDLKKRDSVQIQDGLRNTLKIYKFKED